MRSLSKILIKLTLIAALVSTALTSLVNSKEKDLSYSAFTKFETDFKRFDEDGKTLNLLAGIGVTYRINEKSSLRLSTPFLKSLSGTREFTYLDGSLSFNHIYFKEKEGFSLTSHIGIGLPYSKNSRENTYLQTKITLSPSLNYKVKKIPNLKLTIVPTFTKNFHRSNTNAYGSSNHSYIWSFSGAALYQLDPKSSLELKGSLLKLVTYGAYAKDRYSFEGSYSRSITKNLMSRLSVSNGGELTDYNGDLNVKIFDAQKALFSLSLYYSF